MFKYIITTFVALVFSFSSFANTSWDDILNAKKAPQNWLTHHGSLDGHRFSGLDDINKKNVKIFFAFSSFFCNASTPS